MKNCAIVIPVYRKMNAYEKFSYNVLKLTVKDKDIYAVCGDSFKSELKEKTQRFDDSYFKSASDYSRLCKSYEFYDRFSDYKYILIYQLDCLIFKDEIDYWCNKGYDYIGAPIVSKNSGWKIVPIVGNGGFSLRKVEYFKSITDPNGEFRKKYDKILEKSKDKEKYEEFEDLYFCEFVNSNWLFDVPTIEESVEFAIDMNPKSVFNSDRGLPMGCHAFPKNMPFWENILEFPDDVKEESYREHKDFIEVAYKNKSN